MSEEEIRERTALLLDAYRELTGDDEAPGLPEFLQLRKAALEELGIPAGAEKTRKVREAPKARAEKPKPASGQAVRKNTAAVRKERAEGTPGAKVVNMPARQEEFPAEQEEKPKSDFDILRSIVDPWN